MIFLDVLEDDLDGAECSVYRRASGRLELFVDVEEEPSLEGDDAEELELLARKRNAGVVHHWYEGGRCFIACPHRGPVQ